MSTLEKTIVLLREMPEQSLESLYDFFRSIWIDQDGKTKHAQNPIDISESMEGFRVLQSFAGTLPADFEDCLQDECATQNHADYIITRNTDDFSNSNIPASTPIETALKDHSRPAKCTALYLS